MLDSETELAGMTYLRHSARKSVNGDVEANTGIGVLNYNTTWQTSYGGSVNLTKLKEQHQITSGISFDASRVRYSSSQADDCTLDASRSPINCDPPVADQGVRGKSYALGFYATDTWKLKEQTHLTAAARFNHAGVSNTITGQSKEDFTYNSLNPSAGLSHQLNSAINIFGNVGQSNRVPTVIELGCADENNPCRLPTGLQSDPHLKQVIARTIEAGVRWKLSENSGISTSVYRTENRDDILFRQAGAAFPGQGFFSNFSRTRRQGLDLSAYKSIGAVTLQAGYSYLDATYQASGTLFGGERDIAVTPGTKIAGLPEHTLKMNADWRVTPKFTLGGTLITTSSITTQGNEDGLVGPDNLNTAPVNAKVDGYTVFHLHANYEAAKGLDYFGRINNVFDTRYETYGLMGLSAFDASGSSVGAGNETVNRFVAPGAPRSFMVGLRYRY
jgi:outer membrane receptor protein involved in Fe transport